VKRVLAIWNIDAANTGDYAEDNFYLEKESLT
jgi:hypothetical protein